MKEFVLEGCNGTPLRGYHYPVKDANRVFVIIHGMQEYSGRYVGFCEELNRRNIACMMVDLRGHGKNILKEKQGLDDGDIFLNIVEDQKLLIEKAKKEYPNAKITVFGHSYGSFVAQRLLQESSFLVDKFIICGSNYMNTPLVKSARIFAYFSKLFHGREADANFLEKLSIRSYGKKFENGNWLTRDEKIWEQYNKDKFCGQVFPVAFYESMFKNLPNNYKNLDKVNKKVPILLIAGGRDPVGNSAKGVYKLFRCYLDAGLNVKVKIFEGARHELLNETNKDEVVDVVTK